jgi:cobalt/nickel transport system permease protein
MSSIDASFFDLGRLDRLARQDTVIHRLDPRAKLVATAIFLASVVSHGKYEVAALLPYAVFPIALASAGRIPFSYLGKKMLAVAPFAVLVGMFNPFIDHTVLWHWGSLAITGGWVSFAAILLRFALTIGMALTLVAVTPFDDLCLGLQRLGIPRVFALQLQFLYRYLFVLAEEAVRLVRARALRSFGRRGLGLRAYSSLIGHLLLRTLDRATRIHIAMRCRGFDGELRSPRRLHVGRPEVVFTLGWVALFVALRIWSLPLILGDLTLAIIQ